MTNRGVVLLLLTCLLLVGCTRVIEHPQPSRRLPVAPITAGQVSDLLSKHAKTDEHPNLFVTAAPERCAGLVQEVDAPFIFGTTPAAHDGGQWFARVDEPAVSVQEIVAVYPASFDADAAVAEVRRTIDACRYETITTTTMKRQSVTFRMLPQQDSGQPEIAVWSVSGDHSCDNAFIAAHNAAIELTACAKVNGYDVLALAREALKRIEALANTKL